MMSTTLIERAFVAGAASLALCLPAAAMDGAKKEGMKGAATVSAGTLAENPALYLGKKVTVKAEVENVVGPQVFTLDEDKLAAGPDVLVLMPRTARQMIRDDARVTVTGTVRPFVLTELERDYDWFDPTPGLEIEVKGRPVIVADSVRDAAGAELMTEAGTQSSPAASANKPATQGSAQAGAQQAAKDTVTMTGCLRRTSDADVLVLTDATGGKQTAARRVRVEPAAGVNLSAHVGHKVRLEGSIDEASSGMSSDRTKTETMAETGSASGDRGKLTAADVKQSPILRVSSFEHVAAQCDSGSGQD